MVGRGRRRLPDRPARAAPHRHLLRDDHRRHRGDLLLRRVQPAVRLDRRRERPARRADAESEPRLHARCTSPPAGRCTPSSRSATSSASCSRCASCARRSAPCSRAIRENPLRARGRRPRRAGVQAHGLRDRRRVCRARGRPAGRAAGLHAARCLHVRHLRPADHPDRDRRPRHADRPAGGRRGLAVPAGLPAGDAELGAAWKLVLGVVFVLLVCFLRQGIIGGVRDLWRCARRARQAGRTAAADALQPQPPRRARVAPMPRDAPRRRRRSRARSCRPPASPSAMAAWSPTRTSTSPCTRGELRGIIGPNGAGKSHLLQDAHLRGAAHRRAASSSKAATSPAWASPTSASSASPRATRSTSCSTSSRVRENVTIAALAELRGKFKLDLLRSVDKVPGLQRAGRAHAGARQPRPRAPTRRWPQLAYGEKRRLEIGLALASSPTLLLLDEPLAGMSPSERVETVALLKSIAQRPHAWSSSTTTWTRCSNWPSASPCCRKAGCSPKARPRRSRATRRCRKPIWAACTRRRA